MASFAKIGLNGKVIEVQSVVNEVLHDANGVEQEVNGIDFLTKLTGWAIWKQTSYNNNIRKNFAGIGFTYDEDRDAFIPPKPFNSWVLNEDTCCWESPVANPQDGNKYRWNEQNLSWQIEE
jgi:phosphatidate phosphatase PAH1